MIISDLLSSLSLVEYKWNTSVEAYDPESDTLMEMPIEVALGQLDSAASSLIERIKALTADLPEDQALNVLITLQLKIHSFVTFQNLLRKLKAEIPPLDGNNNDRTSTSSALQDRAQVLAKASQSLEVQIPSMIKAKEAFILKFPLSARRHFAKHIPGIQVDFAARREVYGPEHFEEILNQIVLFFDEEGVETEMALHEAVLVLEDVVEPFFSLVVSNSEIVQLEQQCSKFDRIEDVLAKIQTAAIFLEQDIDGFRSGRAASTSFRLISTRNDIEEVIKKFEETHSKVSDTMSLLRPIFKKTTSTQ